MKAAVCLPGICFISIFNEVLSLEPEISLNGELTMLYREGRAAGSEVSAAFHSVGLGRRRRFFSG